MLLFCSFAFAAAPRDRARAHYEAALELANSGQIGEAVAHFEKAYELSPHYAVLYNLGRAYALLDRNVQALNKLTQYLRDGGDEIPTNRRREVEQQIKSLRLQLAELEIAVDPADSVVRLDDRPIATSRLSGSVYVEPGTHTVVVSRDGYETVQRAISLEAGERERVTVSLTAVSRPMGTLRIECRAPGVEVGINDAPPRDRDLPVLLDIDTGPHTVAFVRGRQGSHVRQIVVERDEVTTVRCEETLFERQPESPSGESRTRAPRHIKDTTTNAGRMRRWSYAGLASGLALGGTAIGLFIWNNDRHDEWKSEDDALESIARTGPPYPTDARTRQDTNNALLRSIQRVDISAIALGVAAIGTATTGAVFLSKAGATPSTDDSSSYEVQAYLGPGMCRFTLGTTF